MKCLLKNWKIGAYFGSIVLAIGIAVFQTTVKEGVTITGKSPAELPDCEVVLADLSCHGAEGCNDYTYKEVDTTRTIKTVLAPTITYGPPATQQCYRADRICTTQGTMTVNTAPCNVIRPTP
jgi:hypothetical protein